MDSEVSAVIEDIIIPPMRNTNSLELSPEQGHIADLARKQLENLNKVERKPKRKMTPPSSDTEVVQSPVSSKTEVKQIIEMKSPHNLSSVIVSKAELENEIRKKIARQDPKKMAGSIEIPHELILSGLNTTPMVKSDEEEIQLHDQELIDILEGKPESDTQIFEVVQEDGRMVLVKDTNDNSSEATSYEIITDVKVSETKAKLLEREIAMRQIASLPVRKNKKSSKTTPNQSIVQSLADDWTDDDKEDEVILEVVNMEAESNEPKIKILNMTILNEKPEAKPKVARVSGELPVKTEPKILNKEAPKILNINASSADLPATFKRTRVVKKKEIWDPSQTKEIVVEKKSTVDLPLQLPPSITIKKLTKESLTKAKPPVEDALTETPKPAAKKVKKRSEIDKLLQDEGAVNMIYALERENNNKNITDIAVNPDQEKSTAVPKARAIRNVAQKQSVSPPEVKTSGRARGKKEASVPAAPKPEVETAPPVTQKVQKAPAGRKKKADNSWDFMYSQAQATCDDAMIIRRRSNSSYSSSAASPRRLSVDVNEMLESPPPSAKKMKQDAFEFTKPPQKNTKSPADKVLNKDFVEELRGKITNVLAKGKEKAQAAAKGRKRALPQAVESPPAKRASERRSNGSDNKEYRLERNGQLAHIIINQSPLSISLLTEMKALLNQLETEECQVVLVTSAEGFSEGLDYSSLIQTTVDKRRQAASDLVTAFKWVKVDSFVDCN